MRERLQFRADVLRAVRAFFVERGFVEVETPAIVRSPGLEPHIRAVRADGGWLVASPEYHMKRLLARGAGRIFQIARCFREDEVGRHHAREFTLLEWYRPDEGWESLVGDLEALLARLAPGRADLAPPFERLTVAEAFARFSGRDPFALPEDAFFYELVDRIEPRIGRERPTILHAWPARYAALARLSPDDPRVALRFELYAGGVEICNAFDELTDPVEQRRRFGREQEERRRRGLDAYPVDERFLEDLARMPPAAGAALGVDRLVMLLAGARDIRDVRAFSEAGV